MSPDLPVADKDLKDTSWNLIKGRILKVRRLAGWSLLFLAQICYIKDKRVGVDSYPCTVKESWEYINLNCGRLFVQQSPKKGKGSRDLFKLIW